MDAVVLFVIYAKPSRSVTVIKNVDFMREKMS